MRADAPCLILNTVIEMNLASYPRPAGDTGIGFHWFPDTKHYSKSHLKRFGPALKALGASWLLLLGDFSEGVPQHFVKELQARGIEPIVHLRTPFVAPIDLKELGQVARRYADMGVRYLFIYDQPNLQAQWAKWPGSEAPDRFMELCLHALETLALVDDLIPLFPPLAPGGSLNDLLFLKRCLDILAGQASANLKDKLGIAIRNSPSNLPLWWGHGGQRAWPASEHGRCPEGSENHMGFCLYEWYDEIVRAHLGRAALMIATGYGPAPGDRAHEAFPPLDESLHAKRVREMAQAMMSDQVPLYLANSAFGLLVAEDGDPFAAHRWYRPNVHPALPEATQALKDLPKQARPALAVPQQVSVQMEDGRVVNMDLEEYLMGVVPREIPTASPLEALKAQAIAARTFAARAVRHPRHGAAAVCTTSHCQNWSPRHYTASSQAVRDTAGVVLTFMQELAGTYYFAHCDGHTRNSEDVWSAVLPYCRSVPCICGNAEMHGHGVGMCQEGAIRMAQQGALAHEILQHYYSGVRVQRADGTSYTE